MATANKDEDLCSFDVPDVKRESSGPTLYKIVLQVTPKDITKNTYQIVYWKRYSDIRKLYEVLHRYHQAVFRPGKFPDFPDKSRFMERFNAAVVEERRIATKQFLNFVLQQLYLRTHDAYLQFLQSGTRVDLPDVQVATLEPECINRPAHPSPPEAVAPETTTTTTNVENEPSTDLLLTIDDENQIKSISNQCANILEDLTDLQFDQQQEIKEEQKEFDLLNDEINEAATLFSLPLTSTKLNQSD